MRPWTVQLQARKHAWGKQQQLLMISHLHKTQLQHAWHGAAAAAAAQCTATKPKDPHQNMSQGILSAAARCCDVVKVIPKGG
jgi:hypothetical protein